YGRSEQWRVKEEDSAARPSFDSSSGITRRAQERRGLSLRCDFVAFLQVQFPGSENWNCFNAVDLFWNPQVWNTCFLKFFAQISKVDIDCAEQHECFTFCFILHADNGEGAFVSA